jgi:hypothetical protein
MTWLPHRWRAALQRGRADLPDAPGEAHGDAHGKAHGAGQVRNMLAACKRLVALAWVSTAMMACADPKLEQIHRVREAACRCQDIACVEAALAQMPDGGPKRERDRRQAQRLAAEILSCVARVGELAVDSPPSPQQTGAEVDPAAPTDSTDSRAP